MPRAKSAQGQRSLAGDAAIAESRIVGEHAGRLLVFESTTINTFPCEITGKCISGSQAHPLEHYILHYHGKVWHYPLYRSLFDHEHIRLTRFLHNIIGLSYDNIGAFRAGGFHYDLRLLMQLEELLEPEYALAEVWAFDARFARKRL